MEESKIEEAAKRNKVKIKRWFEMVFHIAEIKNLEHSEFSPVKIWSYISLFSYLRFQTNCIILINILLL